MGSQLSTLLRSKYTMLPTKDTDTEIRQVRVDQSMEEDGKDVSGFHSLRRLLARYLSRER